MQTEVTAKISRILPSLSLYSAIALNMLLAYKHMTTNAGLSLRRTTMRSA